MPNMIVLAGVPGCGKSTWAEKMFDLKASIFCPDTYREQRYGSLVEAHAPGVRKEANAYAWEKTHSGLEQALQHGIDSIVDATNLWRVGRLQLLEIGWRNKARCHLIVFKNVAEAIDRNAARPEEDRVPTADMERMCDRYYDTLTEVENESWDTIAFIESFK